MKKIIDQASINNITEIGRYPDAVVKHLQLWVKSKQKFYWIYRFKIDEKLDGIEWPLSSFSRLRIFLAC